MADFRDRIDELARLMEEFHLAEARLESDDMTVAFRRRSAHRSVERVYDSTSESPAEAAYIPVPAAPVPEPPRGTPISSPMSGIYYGSSSPSSPPFVKEGDQVAAGQIIGLIEAMKVFNEIPCPMGGTVLKIVAEGGNIVQTGDPLIIIEL